MVVGRRTLARWAHYGDDVAVVALAQRVGATSVTVVEPNAARRRLARSSGTTIAVASHEELGDEHFNAVIDASVVVQGIEDAIKGVGGHLPAVRSGPGRGNRPVLALPALQRRGELCRLHGRAPQFRQSARASRRARPRLAGHQHVAPQRLRRRIASRCVGAVGSRSRSPPRGLSGKRGRAGTMMRRTRLARGEEVKV